MGAEPPPAATVADVLDPAIISNLKRLGRRRGEDVLGRLATLFLADAPGRLMTLQRAIAQDDDESRAACAHALAGSSLGIGARGLAALCATLERDAEVAALAAVEAELARVVTTLTPLAA